MSSFETEGSDKAFFRLRFDRLAKDSEIEEIGISFHRDILFDDVNKRLFSLD